MPLSLPHVIGVPSGLEHECVPSEFAHGSLDIPRMGYHQPDPLRETDPWLRGLSRSLVLLIVFVVVAFASPWRTQGNNLVHRQLSNATVPEWNDFNAAKCPDGFPLSTNNIAPLLHKYTLPDLKTLIREKRDNAQASCHLLSIQGTGSSTVWEVWKNNYHNTGHDHHDRLCTDCSDNSRTCYILTLRDPAERMESMYRFFHYKKYSMELLYDSVSAMVTDLRDPQHRIHNKVKDDVRDDWGETNVHHFFPQLHWLSNFDPSKHEVHVLCTKHLNPDITALAKNLGLEPPNLFIRENRSARDEWSSDDGKRMSHLTKDDAEFVRQCMYPWDTLLYKALCGTGS